MLQKEVQVAQLATEIERYDLKLLKGSYKKISEFKPRDDLEIGFFHTDISQNYISPISISSHNLKSDYLFILQDWAGEDSFKNPTLPKERLFEIREKGFNDRLDTNINFDSLLEETLKTTRDKIYLINSFPFIKSGGTVGKINPSDLLTVNTLFTRKFINIMKPKFIISLGVDVYDALASLEGIDNRIKKERKPFNFIESGSLVLFLNHPGFGGTGKKGNGSRYTAARKLWHDTLTPTITK